MNDRWWRRAGEAYVHVHICCAAYIIWWCHEHGTLKVGWVVFNAQVYYGVGQGGLRKTMPCALYYSCALLPWLWWTSIENKKQDLARSITSRLGSVGPTDRVHEETISDPKKFLRSFFRNRSRTADGIVVKLPSPLPYLRLLLSPRPLARRS